MTIKTRNLSQATPQSTEKCQQQKVPDIMSCKSQKYSAQKKVLVRKTSLSSLPRYWGERSPQQSYPAAGKGMLTATIVSEMLHDQPLSDWT